MNKTLIVTIIVLLSLKLNATVQTASIQINKDLTYQKITGFGGFVNSPQFGYNHMTTAEIAKVWGNNSSIGLNIMRIYLPIGETSWSQCLETAKLAKSSGLTLFASPWSMPAEWKTYNTINAVYTDANGVLQTTSLKEANYANYANYLNNFVSYLHNNGVELDAISIQNEPDEKASYAGCIWSPTQIANFLKNYGNMINCKVIAAESAGMTDNYSTALLADDVLPQFEIYGGHQYGSFQSGFKQIQAKGKQAWMTEFLINWNANTAVAARNFSWSTDAFSFFNAVNTALLGNVNAWIHYASKRYYGLMGDGQYGTTTGEITKRGYILSQFAKYVTGATRIDNTWNDVTNKLVGSSYLSATGDSVFVLISNPSTDSYNLTVDLPFYTKAGLKVRTTEALNIGADQIVLDAESCRPIVTIDPSSITTLVFRKSNVRNVSQMQGTRYNKIEDMQVTNVAFGTAYKLSGNTATFDVNRALLSGNKTNTNGYLMLNNTYNQLVLRVNTISSTNTYNSANTTLYYINAAGFVSSKNYGTVSIPQSGNFDWIFDLSSTVLTDGCRGVLSITNSNYTSVLTINLGDVYFRVGNEGMYKFSGIYSGNDSYFLNCIENKLTTFLDFNNTKSIDVNQNWILSAANKNCVYMVNATDQHIGDNVVIGSTCSQLTLSDLGANFYIPRSITASNASYTKTVNECEVLVLPFEAIIPTGIEAYNMQFANNAVTCTRIENKVISANKPVIIKGTGTFSFAGSGSVSTPHGSKQSLMTLVYLSQKALAGNYVLKTVAGVSAFYLVANGEEPTVPSFSAFLTPTIINQPTVIPLKFNDLNGLRPAFSTAKSYDNKVYDLLGRQINYLKKNAIYIQSGKKLQSTVNVNNNKRH